MIGHDPALETAENYRRFGVSEARGKSPLYEEVALAIADDATVIALLSELPPSKRQPNLFLGAVRYLYGTVTSYPEFSELVATNWPQIKSVMESKSTQTNEVGRCAALLPFLVDLPQPLKLLEIGASAGLCLSLDRYGYDFGGSVLKRDSPVRLPCELHGLEAPSHVPEIGWRLGIDLNPLDPSNSDDRHWLEALVWPGMDGRAARLRAALDIAADNPPAVIGGDLRNSLPEVLKQVPSDGTLVVFHSATLAYVPQPDRSTFVTELSEWSATWIAYEHPAVLAGIVSGIADGVVGQSGDFVIARNGELVATADPHGSRVERL